MMKRIIFAILPLILAACGGASGSSPIPQPQPSSTPAKTLAVRISWTGVAHSTSGTHAMSVSPMDSVQSAEPVEMAIAPPCHMGAPGCNSINANSNFSGANAQIAVVDSSGNPVAEPSPSVSLGTPIASVTPEPQATPASTPQPNAYNVNATSTSAASTTLTATYSNTLAGNINLREFVFAGLEWPTAVDSDAAIGYVLNSSGFLMPQADSTNADIYVAKDTDGTVKMFAPGGIQVYGPTQAIATLTTALPFTSSGTSIPISSLTSNPVVVVKANLGYVALKFGVTQCSYDTTATACDHSAMAGAIYNVAGTDGAFH